MLVTEVQRFCMRDGPGIRTVVFLKGCPLACAWCHNPETQSAAPELLYAKARCVGCGLCAQACPRGAHRLDGTHELLRDRCLVCGRCVQACPAKALRLSAREMTVEEILGEVLKDRAFYGDRGGVTLSGGEPLMRMDQALELLAACKEAGLNTAVETCGLFDGRFIRALCGLTDTFLWDLKDSDRARHRAYTGVDPEAIWENLRRVDAETQGEIVLRCLLVRGVNDTPERIAQIAEIAQTLKHVKAVQFLPCHVMSQGKYEELGRPCRMERSWAADEEDVRRAEEALWNIRNRENA